MILLDLPPENLDHIASAIDSPAELGNLGATCKLLHSIVSPNHTQYREIRAPMLSPVWKKLTENHALAQNVRVVEVQSTRFKKFHNRVDDPIVPVAYRDAEAIVEKGMDRSGSPEDRRAAKIAANLSAERIFVEALEAMVNLTSFHWSHTPTLIDPTKESSVWEVIARLDRILHLHVIDVNFWTNFEEPYTIATMQQEIDDSACHRPTFNPKFFSLGCLKTFSLHTGAYSHETSRNPGPDLERLTTMLVHGCGPDLETLSLSIIGRGSPYRPHISALKESVLSRSWSHLTELKLWEWVYAPEQLGLFLALHPTLERLTLSQQSHYSCLAPSFPSQSLVLPNLRRICAYECGEHVVGAILHAKVYTPRPLEEIQSVTISHDFLDHLHQSGGGPLLKRLGISTASRLIEDTPTFHGLIQRLAEVAPNLEVLTVDSKATLVRAVTLPGPQISLKLLL
ncbi:unnamed protein product [Cyclocybe aegerita]|uniref:F-box domain-containing protein n=1 Tax=Cyclocybe aegerita TaxID=1973307 RepID=A0A8S0VS10_CYCAE|nr:unnamed protein product [Cyclocybe aegerita]